MAATQGEITVHTSDQLTPPRRPTRTAKPSAKVREAMQSLENATIISTRDTVDAMRTNASRGTRAPGAGHGTNNQASTGKTALEMLLEAIKEQRDEMREIAKEQGNTIRELFDVVMRQQNAISELQHQLHQLENALADTKAQLSDTKAQLSEELRQVRDQMDVLTRNPSASAATETSPRASYAEVARTPPASQPSGLRTLSLSNTTPTTFTDTPFCTVDTSRVEDREKGKVQVADIRKAIETEIQTRENQGNWRCAAVVREARNPDRVKIICRDENEVQIVKDAAQKISVPGLRVLRDQLYPIRVDNANRTAVLDADGNILPGAMEALGAENEVSIAKIAWLSRKDTGKAYGSMVVRRARQALFHR